MTGVDIGEFIAARLDEEEADARAAAAHCPEWTYDRTTFTVASAEWVIASGKGSNGPAARVPLNDVDGAHIARQDPAATLARVTALRALVEELGFWTIGHEEIVYRKLAAIWASHPDYRAEWAA